jgi:hypothetical protein
VTRRRPAPVVLATLVALAAALALPLPAAAQSVDAAVEDLRDNDVTFEEGAVDDRDLAELDDAARDLQEDDAYFKIVVLAERVEEHPSVRAYADRVLDGLGGDGRVLVYDPSSAAIASNADSAAEVREAEDAAVDAANRTDSFAEGALAAGRVLVGSEVPSGVDDDDGGGSGSGGWLIWALVIAGVGLGALLLMRRMIGRSEPAGASPAALGAGERTVRSAVDRTANLVLELADPVEAPDAPPEATEAYRQGAAAFMEVQDELEQADTRPELEAVYPRLLEAEWRLQTAKALLEGRTAPAKPQPEPLFPAPPPQARPAPPAEPHYREHGSSPWLTEAAMTAMTILMSRGLGGGGGGGRSHRQPMGDDVFGGLFPTGGGGGGRRGRPRISLGRGGRGMGRR